MSAGGGARAIVVSAFERAVRGFDLGARVVAALPPRPPARARVRVLAVGKAAPAMARAAIGAWRARVDAALVVTPDGTATHGLPSAEVRFAGHPLPDARSVEAGERALALAAQEAHDLLLVLVSGGASSLLWAPVEGVTLDDAVGVARALLLSGAPIEALNVVRRHLSRVHGGGLARAAAPGRVLALVASDVLAGALHDVGSGPTTFDPTTSADARAALERWAPAHARLPLHETLKADEPAARRQRARLVAAPEDLAAAVGRELTGAGFEATILGPSGADVRALADEYAGLAARLAPGHALIRAAEPSVTVDVAEPGRGGRSGHLAAIVAPRLPPGVVFLAGASDGVDGSSGAAGAVVDRTFAATLGGRLVEALDAFDSARLHDEAGTAIRLGPTGQNLADVHVLAREVG